MKSLVEAIKAVFKFIFILGIVYWMVKDDLEFLQGIFPCFFLEGFCMQEV